MNRSKRRPMTIASVLILLFLFSGCSLFTEGKKKLNLYCPGLNISIDGVKWNKTGLRNIFVLQYDADFQKQVDAYFTKKENGFAEVKNSDFSDVELNHEAIIDKRDIVLEKVVQLSKRTSKVICDESTRKIVIVEYSTLKMIYKKGGEPINQSQNQLLNKELRLFYKV